MASFEKHGKLPAARHSWQMERVVEAVYPKPGYGRPPIGLKQMLRIYFLQHWFSLSDPAVEEVLYDSTSMRRFVGIDRGREPAPDETTILRFRHLLVDTTSATRCSTG